MHIKHTHTHTVTHTHARTATHEDLYDDDDDDDRASDHPGARAPNGHSPSVVARVRVLCAAMRRGIVLI